MNRRHFLQALSALATSASPALSLASSGTPLVDYIRSVGEGAIAAQCSASPEFAVFNLLWSDPPQIIPACQRMGWQTVEDLAAWIAATNSAIGNTAAFTQLIDPLGFIDPAALPRIEFLQIQQAIAAQSNIRPDCFWDQSDLQYYLPSKAQIDWLAQNNPHATKKWAWETNDCDDFVRSFLGWMASNGLGNLAIGFCNQTPSRNGEWIGGHVTAIACDDQMNAWIIDPQSRVVCSPKSLQAAQLGGYWVADSMELARVLF